MTEMTQEQFVHEIRSAIRDNPNARAFYFPSDKAKRKAMNLRLAREVGAGLTDLSCLNSLYSLLIVSFSFDNTGVCIDAKEFMTTIVTSWQEH